MEVECSGIPLLLLFKIFELLSSLESLYDYRSPLCEIGKENAISNSAKCIALFPTSARISGSLVIS